MREKASNLMVGLTVLVALALLGGMIVIFRELPGWMRGGYELQAEFPNASGIIAGADVMLVGKRIGRVAEVTFADDDPRRGVIFILAIKRSVDVPGDVNPYIRSRGFAGGAILELVSDGREPGKSRGRQFEWLPRDQIVMLRLPKDVSAGPTGLIPPELVRSIQTTMTKFGTALDSINKVIGDEENRKNIKSALAGFNAAAEAMTKAMNKVETLAASSTSAIARYEKLAGKLTDDADQLGKLLTSLANAAEKIQAGEGTAGKLINDPKLYNELVETAAQIKETFATLGKLLEEWKAKGVGIKLK